MKAPLFCAIAGGLASFMLILLPTAALLRLVFGLEPYAKAGMMLYGSALGVCIVTGWMEDAWLRRRLVPTAKKPNQMK